MKDLHKYLSRSWCPLFGALPPKLDPLNHPINKCIEIIEDVRVIWGRFLLGFCFNDEWPSPQEVEEQLDFPAQTLTLARNLYIVTPSVWKHARKYPDELINKYGRAVDFEINNVPKIAAYLARTLCDVRVGDDIPDYAILAIIALREAEHAFLIFVDSYENEEKQAYNNLLRGIDLIEQVKTLKRNEEKIIDQTYIKELENYKNLTTKYQTDRRNKQLDNNSGGGYERSFTYQPTRFFCYKKGQELREKHPNWKPSDIANHIEKLLAKAIENGKELKQVSKRSIQDYIKNSPK